MSAERKASAPAMVSGDMTTVATPKSKSCFCTIGVVNKIYSKMTTATTINNQTADGIFLGMVSLLGMRIKKLVSKAKKEMKTSGSRLGFIDRRNVVVGYKFLLVLARHSTGKIFITQCFFDIRIERVDGVTGKRFSAGKHRNHDVIGGYWVSQYDAGARKIPQRLDDFFRDI